MGTMLGHVVPGVFLLVYGAWWSAHIWARRLTSSRLRRGYKASLSVDLKCGRGCRIPTDGVLKIVLTLVVYGVESMSYRGDRWFYRFVTSQHCAIYSFFLLSGVVDILVSIKRLHLPRGLEYVTFAMTFAMEGLIFKFHLRGRNSLDVMLHTLMVYCSFGCALTVLLEMRYRGNVLISLMRCFLLQLKGSWFIQLGVVLFSTNDAHIWNRKDETNMMLGLVVFALHVSLNFISVLVMGGIVACLYRVVKGRTLDIKAPEWKREQLLENMSEVEEKVALE